MDWLVEYLDAHEGIILTETYVGISSPALLARRIAHQLDIDVRLEGVAGWTVHVIDGDNVVDSVDKS